MDLAVVLAYIGQGVVAARRDDVDHANETRPGIGTGHGRNFDTGVCREGIESPT